MARLKRTVHTAMRMLDNVIDINFYTVPEARESNLRHRPVGLGIMGYQDALYKLRIPFSSTEAVRFADESHGAASASRRSPPPSISPPSAAATPASKARCGARASSPSTPSSCCRTAATTRCRSTATRTLDWATLRERVRTVGMRNSNTLAIAPTATISNICGVTQSIEPTYQNLFVKSNMSGDFTVVNAALVHDLKAAGLWDEVMISDLKYFDGSARHHRPRPRRAQAPLRHLLRDRADLAHPGRGLPSEVDRSGAVAEPLHRSSPAARSSTRSTAKPGTQG